MQDSTSGEALEAAAVEALPLAARRRADRSAAAQRWRVARARRRPGEQHPGPPLRTESVAPPPAKATTGRLAPASTDDAEVVERRVDHRLALREQPIHRRRRPMRAMLGA
jgi:hypothetical protein